MRLNHLLYARLGAPSTSTVTCAVSVLVATFFFNVSSFLTFYQTYLDNLVRQTWADVIQYAYKNRSGDHLYLSGYPFRSSCLPIWVQRIKISFVLLKTWLIIKRGNHELFAKRVLIPIHPKLFVNDALIMRWSWCDCFSLPIVNDACVILRLNRPLVLFAYSCIVQGELSLRESISLTKLFT